MAFFNDPTGPSTGRCGFVAANRLGVVVEVTRLGLTASSGVFVALLANFVSLLSFAASWSTWIESRSQGKADRKVRRR